MIHLKLDVNDIGLLCVVLSDVIESNEFVDNKQLSRIHDKLKDSILYKINPDNEKNKNEIEFLRKNSIEKIEYHTKHIMDLATLIEEEGSLHKFANIYASCNQILQVHLKYLKHD